MKDIDKDFEKLLKKALEMPGIADLMRLTEELHEVGKLLAQLQVEEGFIATTSDRSFFEV